MDVVVCSYVSQLAMLTFVHAVDLFGSLSVELLARWSDAAC